jgi:3-oxoacyl-[acyl-carrier-protein] synthase III
MQPPPNQSQLEQWIRKIVTREMTSTVAAPAAEADLVRTGLLDSMGWVGVLTGIEELMQIENFGNPWPEGLPQSIRGLTELAGERIHRAKAQEPEGLRENGPPRSELPVCIAGWGWAVGSVNVSASEMERDCGLSPGTIQKGAGIESLRIVSEDQDHLSLAGDAAENALEAAHTSPADVDVLVAVSSTFAALPTFGPRLHTQLLLPERCAVLDAGGACVGLLNAFKLASAILAMQGRGTALVVASEVNSRLLASVGAPGELRGLFGDGACAFALRPCGGPEDRELMLGGFAFGCSGGDSSGLKVAMTPMAEFEFEFRGEHLGRAAIGMLSRTIEQLERISGRSRSEGSNFVVHEPNPRLVQIFAQNSQIPLDKIQMVSRSFGNLGSATCGVNLCKVLDAHQREPVTGRPLIFVVAVGPGLLWAGTYLH